MEFYIKPFSELTTSELHAIYMLRSLVFVVEQNCAYQDVDEKDLNAWHLMFFRNSDLIAYCRILPPGVSYAECSIGRVVTAPNERGKGTGRLLMEEAIKQAGLLFKTNAIVISAQTYLIQFYKSLGFNEEGEVYPEDDIPHIKMRLLSNRNS